MPRPRPVTGDPPPVEPPEPRNRLDRPHHRTQPGRLLLPVVLACGMSLWLRLVDVLLVARADESVGGPEYLALDAMLVLPAAVVAVQAAAALTWPERADWRSVSARSAYTALALSVLLVPVMALRDAIHALVQVGDGGTMLPATGPADALGRLGPAVAYALAAEPAGFVLALATSGMLLTPVYLRRLLTSARLAGLLGLAAALAVTLADAPLPAAAASDKQTDSTVTHASRGCDDPAVPKRTYDVEALHVDIALNRYGDHDPYGYMYVLKNNEAAVRAFEATTTGPNPTTKVSIGLREDPIQPLVLRARLGECVVIHFTNGIDLPPHAGNDQPVSGVPSVSIDVQGVPYQIADGGSAVGENPASRMTPPGGTNTYRFYLDPLSGEGGKLFHSGGDARTLTAHGLFGAIIAEPPGSRWFDPQTGVDKTDDANWSNWEAMIQPGSGVAFREFALMYHEVGDEDSHLRRPASEGPGPDGLGGLVPMIDAKLPHERPVNEETGDVEFDDNDGAGTEAYRPDGRAINYRSEPFWRRLQQLGTIAFPDLPVDQLDRLITDEKGLGYSSYTFGDPATPMPRSYLGEPTKTRLMHPGSEQLHVHHLHGGGDRWRANPNADDTDMAGGLEKNPAQTASSIRLDSQTVGPDESYNLEHECGAGGCQQAAGDFLFHCHIAEHYVAGMWGFWRVFDTRQPDLAPLPDRSAPPAAVTSDQLLGKTFEGKTVVLSVTDPASQVSLRDWVERQLPPPGVRIDRSDATVWDWTVGGTPTAPVYLGEPEDTHSWADYTPAHPGARDPILFDPVNGRYAWH